MFERFTERARQVVVLAQDEARGLGHSYIGTEHILLGLVREEEGLAARLLTALAITLEEVRAQVVETVGRGDAVAAGQIPFTPRAKEALELSLREALSLGHNYIGTEHVLLGLARVEDGMAARILAGFGADSEILREETVKLLSGETPPERVLERRPIELDDVDEWAGWTGYAPDPEPRSERHGPLIVAIALATASFPVGLAVGWLIWG